MISLFERDYRWTYAAFCDLQEKGILGTPSRPVLENRKNYWWLKKGEKHAFFSEPAILLSHLYCVVQCISITKVFWYSASEAPLSPVACSKSMKQRIHCFINCKYTRVVYGLYETREAGSRLIPKYLWSLLQLRPNLDKKKSVTARGETWPKHETSIRVNSPKALGSWNYSMNLSMSQLRWIRDCTVLQIAGIWQSTDRHCKNETIVSTAVEHPHRCEVYSGALESDKRDLSHEDDD